MAAHLKKVDKGALEQGADFYKATLVEEAKATRVAEVVDLTGEVATPRHLPAGWDAMGRSERQAWVYDWHQAHPGQRMCPSCHSAAAVKYILKQLRNGRSQFTCNSFTCRGCYTWSRLDTAAGV